MSPFQDFFKHRVKLVGNYTVKFKATKEMKLPKKLYCTINLM